LSLLLDVGLATPAWTLSTPTLRFNAPISPWNYSSRACRSRCRHPELELSLVDGAPADGAPADEVPADAALADTALPDTVLPQTALPDGALPEPAFTDKAPASAELCCA